MARNPTFWACETVAVFGALRRATPHPSDEVHCVPVPDPAIGERVVVLQHPAGNDQALLLDAHAGAVFHLLLQVVDAVLGAHVDDNGLAKHVPHKDLHLGHCLALTLGRRLALMQCPEHAEDALLGARGWPMGSLQSGHFE
eukprot:CAMPEP_0204555152 /NCGR_PEP_ID=MMETSP0661-20131031/28629_1 /ASSEMBLY_ACC=CAM_ASM_000606 /TAXON_ID=109239 /ORGANISM="Alexandrium margalefi, Strain AMGDE01CS-322" /LENGTH=140 /DNA_ID=CAMNT_0051562237 /DNA_START=51 /DNA_END=471 /DNA_ORIENTATION=+